jgi:hypothetical protein
LPLRVICDDIYQSGEGDPSVFLPDPLNPFRLAPATAERPEDETIEVGMPLWVVTHIDDVLDNAPARQRSRRFREILGMQA